MCTLLMGCRVAERLRHRVVAPARFLGSSQPLEEEEEGVGVGCGRGSSSLPLSPVDKV